MINEVQRHPLVNLKACPADFNPQNAETRPDAKP